MAAKKLQNVHSNLFMSHIVCIKSKMLNKMLTDTCSNQRIACGGRLELWTCKTHFEVFISNDVYKKCHYYMVTDDKVS